MERLSSSHRNCLECYILLLEANATNIEMGLARKMMEEKVGKFNDLEAYSLVALQPCSPWSEILHGSCMRTCPDACNPR